MLTVDTVTILRYGLNFDRCTVARPRLQSIKYEARLVNAKYKRGQLIARRLI